MMLKTTAMELSKINVATATWNANYRCKVPATHYGGVPRSAFVRTATLIVAQWYVHSKSEDEELSRFRPLMSVIPYVMWFLVVIFFDVAQLQNGVSRLKMVVSSLSIVFS